MKIHARIVAGAVLLGMASQIAHGALIAENPTTAEVAAGYRAVGQEVITGPGGPWSHLSFNVHRSANMPGQDYAGEPYAFETLYLLGQEYLGSPSNLSAATTGYLAHTSTIQPVGADGSEWVFAPEVTLQPNQSYWFYTNALSPAIMLSFTDDTYPGGGLPCVSGDGQLFAR